MQKLDKMKQRQEEDKIGRQQGRQEPQTRCIRFPGVPRQFDKKSGDDRDKKRYAWGLCISSTSSRGQSSAIEKYFPKFKEQSRQCARECERAEFLPGCSDQQDAK